LTENGVAALSFRCVAGEIAGIITLLFGAMPLAALPDLQFAN
jgi:hypothetical protein